MRVKINASHLEVDELVFGKKYFIAYAGTSWGEEFLFTRKNKIEMGQYKKEEEEKLIKISSYWVSRKKLKEILNSGAIHWMSEIE